MKKIIELLLVLAVCVTAFCGCGETDNKSSAEDSAISESVSVDPSEYTYIVSPMQGVSSCVYYGPDEYVPNCTDQEAARNKIHVWTVCPTCGGDGDAWNYTIEVKDLDFSSGDTIPFTQSTSCYDCQTRRGIPSFLWSISITRKKK